MSIETLGKTATYSFADREAWAALVRGFSNLEQAMQMFDLPMDIIRKTRVILPYELHDSIVRVSGKTPGSMTVCQIQLQCWGKEEL